MSQSETHAQTYVRNAIHREKPSLFKLADRVLESGTSYDTLAVDALSGYFVGQFLCPLLSRAATDRGETPPSMINIALSSKAKSYSRQKEVVGDFIGASDAAGTQVLLATEFRGHGRHLNFLARRFISAGACVDFAVLATPHSADFLSRQTRRIRASAQLFLGRENSLRTPKFFTMPGSPMREATGLRVEAGNPQPIPDPNARPQIVAAGHTALNMLVEEYLMARF